MQKTLKIGFAATLLVVFAFGVTMTSEPAHALGVVSSNCPYTACPSDLSGYTPDGYCLTVYDHDCTEKCDVYRSPSGQRCKSTSCYWY